MIIDFRSRPPYGSFATNTRLFPRMVDADFPHASAVPALNQNSGDLASAQKTDMSLYLAEMDAAGISLAVVAGRKTETEGYVDNNDLVRLVQEYPDRFRAMAGLDLNDTAAAIEELTSLVREHGFIGAALEPGYAGMYADDERLLPVYETCDTLGVLVCLTQSIFVGPDMTYCHPVHIQRMANRFPNLRFIVDHGCWPYVQECLGLAMVCPNVYLVPDFYGYIPDMPMADEFVKAANYYLKYRMLFGSGYPIRAQGQSVQQFSALPFRVDVLPELLCGNAQRLLGL